MPPRGWKNGATSTFVAWQRTRRVERTWKSHVASLMACVTRERDASQRTIINYVLRALPRLEGETKASGNSRDRLRS